MSAGDTLIFRRRERRDRVTGRTWTQLTSGPGYTYPLYFFGPTVSADGHILVFYRFVDGRVQNWKLDLRGDQAVQLTDARTPNCLWRFWDEPAPAAGVRELMSALNTATDELLYWENNDLRAVHLHSLQDRLVYHLPDDREPCALPGASPDGRWLAMAHVDRAWWQTMTAKGCPPRHEAKNVRLDIVDLRLGTARTLLAINSWITHVNFHDNQRILFCHPASECGLLMTDLSGGWYVHLRPQISEGWELNHYLSTARGILYETISPGAFGVMGVCDPATYAWRDYRMDHPISHCGGDAAGKLWLAQSYRIEPRVEHFLAWVPQVDETRVNALVALSEGFVTFGRGQRSHPHPVLLADRTRLLFTGPDETTQSNHLFLLDVADLADAETAIGASPAPRF